MEVLLLLAAEMGEAVWNIADQCVENTAILAIPIWLLECQLYLAVFLDESLSSFG